MKKTLVFIVTLLLAMSLARIAHSEPRVLLDGQAIVFDVPPVIVEGRTLVPLRAIFEALGAEVGWDGNTQTVTATKATTEIKLIIGGQAYKNGQLVTLDVPAKIVDGRTMVPLRFVSEAMGSQVDWDGNTQIITITSSSGSVTIKVHFIDVGQADAIYISLPNKNDILIDGGNKADGSLVVNYLKNQNVDDIELMIVTHPHEDHIGGLPAVLDAFIVEKIIDSGKAATTKIYKEYAAKAAAEGAVWEQDNRQVFSFGNVVLTIFTGTETWGNINDYSVVARLDTGEIEFLFMGDAEGPAENALTGEYRSEILKVGHHGSNTSSSTSLLSKVKAEVAVISVGKGNSYGHPSTDTLERLKSIGAKIYRTDLNGDIIILTDGTTYNVSTAR